MKDTFGIDITTDWFGRNVPSTMEDVAAESDDEFAIFDDVDLTGNPWAQAGWPQEDWPDPWMLSTGLYICGDGSPTFAMLPLQENDEKYQDRKFQDFNGGFHTILETHEMRGMFFGSTHLREIWQLWRATTPQLNWVMSPGDPNRVEDEMKMYYLGMICAAVYALLAQRK